MILYVIYNADLLDMLALLEGEDSIGYVNDTIVITFSKDFYATMQTLE